ncbi:ATP-binding protein [Acuticoccus mangrovi]|uniref:ATP-grasp domain-containing protein n=1 Tax=Acuticoccus mangrovi TaxID=2796142 RepID=A0A934IFJ9_9HYPH|nr:biotin carboxylase N-terminal domain-containing protein [Acuticoccus mangrovi]MBJ3775729.1 ATP-grasp domain-containing protein [Acuticoccus mangrovi]
MFDKLLVANRGEIAVRIMKTARRLGIRTVAVYSEADRDAMHVRTADEAILIGPADARRSYLDKDRIIAAAQEAGAAAIHPGYGFLSENAAFAEACAASGIVFVGPPAAAIRAMGSKSEAKALMERAGVPVVPGYHGDLQDPSFLKRKAYEVGYPVLIKAISGGGGKGMRRVDKAILFEEGLEAAKREAESAFGDSRVLVERFIDNPRHIEVQVFADAHGRTVSLHERDCSVQRRHQKVIEEAPAPGMTPELRAAMGAAAVRAAEAVGYVGAGTVEFIVEGGESLSADRFFFMEMNTRLQVEHPVTEMVTGLDLVEWQLRVAAGEPLPLDGDPPGPDGHAVEARLYAEDPDNGFMPSAGRLVALRVPEDVRLDSGVEVGDAVSPFYDPMIAKIIVHGRDRADALARMADALDRAVAIGPKTNLAFLRAVVTHEEVLDARHDTGFVDRELEGLTGGSVSPQAIADAATSLIAAPPPPVAGANGWVDPFAENDAFRITGDAVSEVALKVDGADRLARLRASPDGLVLTVDGLTGRADSDRVIEADGDAFAVEAGRAVRISVVDQLSRVLEAEETANSAAAPMHGRIVAIFVRPGEVVGRDAKLFAIEAMKMEHTVKAAAEARIMAVHFAAGDQVGEGAEVITLGAPDAEMPDTGTGHAEPFATATPAMADDAPVTAADNDLAAPETDDATPLDEADLGAGEPEIGDDDDALDFGPEESADTEDGSYAAEPTGEGDGNPFRGDALLYDAEPRGDDDDAGEADGDEAEEPDGGDDPHR